MATIDHPIGLNLEENKAFQEKAWSHTLGIVNRKGVVSEDERTRSELIGTGCACLWRRRKLVLTAKHVLGRCGTADIAFLPRVGNSLGWDAPGEIQGIAERVVVGVEGIVRCQWEDLAAILLKPDQLEPLNVEFCELPRRLALDQTVKGEGSVLLIGYPVDQTFEVSESKHGNHTTKWMGCPSDSFWGELVGSPECSLDSSYDPDCHVLIRFQPSKGGSKPHGYSGAAVWCDPTRRGAVWTANPILLGVETCAYQKSALVRAVRARMVRQFLEESL
jgi:hypothetical protein